MARHKRKNKQASSSGSAPPTLLRQQQRGPAVPHLSTAHGNSASSSHDRTPSTSTTASDVFRAAAAPSSGASSPAVETRSIRTNSLVRSSVGDADDSQSLVTAPDTPTHDAAEDESPASMTTSVLSAILARHERERTLSLSSSPPPQQVNAHLDISTATTVVDVPPPNAPPPDVAPPDVAPPEVPPPEVDSDEPRALAENATPTSTPPPADDHSPWQISAAFQAAQHPSASSTALLSTLARVIAGPTSKYRPATSLDEVAAAIDAHLPSYLRGYLSHSETSHDGAAQNEKATPAPSPPLPPPPSQQQQQQQQHEKASLGRVAQKTLEKSLGFTLACVFVSGVVANDALAYVRLRSPANAAA